MLPDAPPTTPSLDEPPPAHVAEAPIVLPARLPAQCFLSAAHDYVLPALVLVAIVKHESRGHSIVHRNTDGSNDLGVAQINDRYWGRYMQTHHNISAQAMLASPCQSIRVMAYALRTEMNQAECKGIDVWCAVGRYHAPYSQADRAAYVPKVRSELEMIERTRRFE